MKHSFKVGDEVEFTFVASIKAVGSVPDSARVGTVLESHTSYIVVRDHVTKMCYELSDATRVRRKGSK